MPLGGQPGASAQMGALKVVLADSIPKFTGDNTTGVTVRQWFHSLESLFISDGVNEDARQLSLALTNIDYTKGDARHVAMMSEFTSYGELKTTFLSYFEKVNFTPTVDFQKITACTWTSNMSFPSFATQLAAATETLERSKLFTIGTGYEIAKATILINVKRLFSADTHNKLERVAETSKCATHACLQKFLMDTFRLTEHERKNERVFAMGELADELDTCFVGSPRKQVHFGRESEARFSNNGRFERYNQRPHGSMSPQRPSHRGGSPVANRSYDGNRPFSRRPEGSYRDRSPNYRHDRDGSYSSTRDRQRSQSRSPNRSYECWNCGEFHLGGASTCTVCLICGNSNHPTRECRNRKKYMPSKRGVNVLVEGRTDECYESEIFL